jgi:cobalamin biosynthesis protein CobW
MLSRKIPVTVITGFLGAGKTSLVRHLLENAGGRKLALVINEFGDIGVDAEILKGCGDETCNEDDLVELTNGCLCCTVADEFLPTLEMLLDRPEPVDHIIIETSGLALPKPLLKAFQWPEVKSRTTVDGVIAVIDGPAVSGGLFATDLVELARLRKEDPSLDHDSPLEELFEDQLNSADLVIVSKQDLMTETVQNEVHAQVTAKVRDSVQVIAASHGKLDADIILGVGAAVEDDLDNRKSHHDDEDDHEHDDFESFIIELDAVSQPEILATRIENVLSLEGVLRVKGFADVTGKPARLLVQGVGQRLNHYYDRPWKANEDRRTQLVVIGLSGLDRIKIEATLRA